MRGTGTSWQDLTIGGVIVRAGNSVEYETGGWRALRPVINWDNSSTIKGCTRCLICWLFCPDSAMVAEDGIFQGVDLDHCKGCGICAQVCPPKCILMVEESRFQAPPALPKEVG